MYTNSELLKISPFRDSHMHFTVDGKPASLEQIVKIKDKYKNHGIFYINDMGHKTGIGLEAKRVLDKDMVVRSAGFAIFKKGGYGIFLGKAVKEIEAIYNGGMNLSSPLPLSNIQNSFPNPPPPGVFIIIESPLETFNETLCGRFVISPLAFFRRFTPLFPDLPPLIPYGL
jgi:hypothetical protein